MKIGANSGNIPSSKEVTGQAPVPRQRPKTAQAPANQSQHPVQTQRNNVSVRRVQSANTSPNTQNFVMPVRQSSRTQATQSAPRTGNAVAQQAITELSALKKNPAAFATKMNEMLRDPAKRSALIQHFNLNSPENRKSLGIAMFLESGQGLKSNEMMPVGAVILNRALANNLALAASGRTANVSIAEVIREHNPKGQSQFAIRSRFDNAMNGRGESAAIGHGTGTEVNGMINNLYNGQVGTHSSAANAYFFQRGRLNHESFKEGGHSFSQTPTSVQYVNGNYIVRSGGNGYTHK